ncbi:MAG: phosphoadenosine phosphosulfate reductase family protein [Methanomassiliicoccales archaeon]|nr:phosphoadenosine phosphosulfate reductase family protein [Methanomassiliicoccales archaeon]
MGVVHLGKMHLRWCRNCNLPILEERRCGTCGNETYVVDITPPGDVRPAFPYDIKKIIEIVDKQFGLRCGERVIPEGTVVLLNKVPALDRMDEVIVNGEVAGALRYDIGMGWRFLLRMPAARAISDIAERGFVIADDGTIEPIVERHTNLMAPGVLETAEELKVGDEVVILTKDRFAFATGTARMPGKDMMERKRGVAVKVRWAERPMKHSLQVKKPNWSDVLKANETVISRRVNDAIRFIRETVERCQLPCAVSFSGGKDSLACLLLTIDAGFRFPILFIDTGLEFEETVQYVLEIAKKYELEVIVEKASENAFYGHLDVFGPPGRDYRWCCKTNKLGPTVKAITKNFPGGLLSFIGQRRYESESRAEKNRVWKNPWTPGQIGASPIQDWTALHVWLYIFSKGEKANPWYEKGLDRIGCYLCPASDLSELEIVEMNCAPYNKWKDYLYDYASRKGFSADWVNFGLWRWKTVPQSIVDELKRLGKDDALRHRHEFDEIDRVRAPQRGLTLIMQEGFSPCIKGYSAEGVFNKPLNFMEVCNLLNIVGEVEVDSGGNFCRVNDVIVTKEGAIIAKGHSPDVIKENVEKVRQAVVKAMECVGCGVCIARCTKGALMLEQDHIRILPHRCVHCGKCIEPCPALSFGDSAFDF